MDISTEVIFSKLTNKIVPEVLCLDIHMKIWIYDIDMIDMVVV